MSQSPPNPGYRSVKVKKNEISSKRKRKISKFLFILGSFEYLASLESNIRRGVLFLMFTIIKRQCGLFSLGPMGIYLDKCHKYYVYDKQNHEFLCKTIGTERLFTVFRKYFIPSCNSRLPAPPMAYNDVRAIPQSRKDVTRHIFPFYFSYYFFLFLLLIA